MRKIYAVHFIIDQGERIDPEDRVDQECVFFTDDGKQCNEAGEPLEEPYYLLDEYGECVRTTAILHDLEEVGDEFRVCAITDTCPLGWIPINRLSLKVLEQRRVAAFYTDSSACADAVARAFMLGFERGASILLHHMTRDLRFRVRNTEPRS